MYMSSILWKFKPGMREHVRQVLQDQILPVLRQVPGLRHVYAAPTEGDTWLSVLFYDSQAQAVDGLNMLVPVVRGHLGDSLEGMERHAGDVMFEEHGRSPG